MELENITEESTVVRWEEYSRDTESEWNGLLVALQPQLKCSSGNLSVSASADTEGTTEVEASVELTNEEENLSFEVSGSVSHNSDGSTSAKGEVEFKKSW